MFVSADGYIDNLGGGAPSEDIQKAAFETVNLSGKIIMPGFVSGHSHSWQSAFRGIAPDGELWEWLVVLIGLMVMILFRVILVPLRCKGLGTNYAMG